MGARPGDLHVVSCGHSARNAVYCGSNVAILQRTDERVRMITTLAQDSGARDATKVALGLAALLTITRETSPCLPTGKCLNRLTKGCCHSSTAQKAPKVVTKAGWIE